MLRVIGRSLKDLGSDYFTTAVCSLVWLVSQLLVIPGPPATMALFYLANQMAHEEIVDPRDFLRAMPRYFWLGWRWGAVNLIVLAILWGDLYFTGQLNESPLTRILQGVYLTLLVIWLMVQLLSLPFLFEQVSPSLRQGWRNGLVLLTKNPLFSFGVALATLLLLIIGVPLFLISLAVGALFIALVGNHAVLDRLEVN